MSTQTAVEEIIESNNPVEAWRLECLLRAGWDIEHAQVIAVTDVDLHLACRMVFEQGCTVELAFEILA